MKKIGIDVRLYSQTGVGTYLRNFIYELSLLKTEDTTFCLYMLPQDIKKLPPLPSNFKIRETTSLWHTLSEQIDFLQILNQDNLDLMHFTYFGYPILYKRKFIATIHDLTPLLFKTGKASTRNSIVYAVKHFFFSLILRSQVNNAVSIITPTKTVKDQLIQVYGAQIKDKIFVQHEGVGYELISAKENESLYTRYRKPFFIYVGNFYPHKNVKRLIEAFSKVKSETQLILVGPRDFFAKSIAEHVKQLNMEDRVYIVDNATTSDLVFFYTHAQALIHPSLSEGFGLPIVEAVHFNLPIIASHIPVFRELMGNIYHSFNPYEVSDIQDKISDFLKNPKKSDYKSILKQYSFRTMTQQTLSLYRSALESS